jgi:hypothetical protein
MRGKKRHRKKQLKDYRCTIIEILAINAVQLPMPFWVANKSYLEHALRLAVMLVKYKEKKLRLTRRDKEVTS